MDRTTQCVQQVTVSIFVKTEDAAMKSTMLCSQRSHFQDDNVDIATLRGVFKCEAVIDPQKLQIPHREEMNLKPHNCMNLIVMAQDQIGQRNLEQPECFSCKQQYSPSKQ